MAVEFSYQTKGVCSKQIDLEIENDIVTKVVFHNGCNGNLKGIGSLVEGMRVDDVIVKLRGTACGMKESSCPDQLALALTSWKAGKENIRH